MQQTNFCLLLSKLKKDKNGEGSIVQIDDPGEITQALYIVEYPKMSRLIDKRVRVQMTDP